MKYKKHYKHPHGIFDGGIDIITGVIDCKGNRFGFVRSERGDVFVGSNSLFGARHGDTVRVLITDDRSSSRGNGRRREGRVIEISEKNMIMNFLIWIIKE